MKKLKRWIQSGSCPFRHKKEKPYFQRDYNKADLVQVHI